VKPGVSKCQELIPKQEVKYQGKGGVDDVSPVNGREKSGNRIDTTPPIPSKG